MNLIFDRICTCESASRHQMLDHALTVSLGPVLQTEREGDDGVVLEELRGEGVPPQVIALLRPLLQPLVHLVDAVVGLQGTNS